MVAYTVSQQTPRHFVVISNSKKCAIKQGAADQMEGGGGEEERAALGRGDGDRGDGEKQGAADRRKNRSSNKLQRRGRRKSSRQMTRRRSKLATGFQLMPS